MTQHAQEPSPAPGAAPAPTRTVRVMALVGVALAVVFYLLGFVRNVGTIDLVGVLVIGGGLLGGCAALPRAGRVLPPALVMATLGTLALLQAVAAGGVTARLVLALAVAALEAAVLLVAVLMEAGVIGASRSARRPAPTADAPQPGWSPVQGIPPMLAGADPTVTYLGHGAAALPQPTSDATADPATVVGAPYAVGSAPVFGAAQEAYGTGADQTVVGTGASPFASLAGSEPATTVQAGTARPDQPSFAAAEPATAVARGAQSPDGESADVTSVVRGGPSAFGASEGATAVAGGVQSSFGESTDVTSVVRGGQVGSGGSADPATSVVRGGPSAFGGSGDPAAHGGPSLFGEKADPATAFGRGAQSPYAGPSDPATSAVARSAEGAGERAAAGPVPADGADPATTATVPGTPSTAPGAPSPVAAPSEQRAGRGSFPGSAEPAATRGAAQSPYGGAAEPGPATVASGLPRRGSVDPVTGSGQPSPAERGIAAAANTPFGAPEPAGPGGARHPSVFAVGESGAVPLYGGQPTRQAPTGSHAVPTRHGEVPTPRYDQPGQGQPPTGSPATQAQPDPSPPRYGLAGAVNGSSGPHREGSDAQAGQAFTGSHRAPTPDNPAPHRTPPSDRASGAHPLAPENTAPRYGPADEGHGGPRTQREADPAGGQERGSTPSNGRSRAGAGRAASPGTSGAHRAPMPEGSTGANGAAQPAEGSVPLFGSPATNGASGPSHAAPTGEHPMFGQAKANGTSGPSHAARTGEHPVYGLFTAGSRSARRAAAAAAQERRPDGAPTTQGEPARPRPNRSGREPGDATGASHGTASAKPEHRPSAAESDPTPETTAFPVQQARSASDPTPAWGQAALPEENEAPTPEWLGRPDGAAAAPAPRSPTENRPGRHGHPDEARKDATRVFPSSER